MSWEKITDNAAWNLPWVAGAARQRFALFEDDRTGAAWRHSGSGDEIALVADGGWRMTLDKQPYPSQYRLFWFSAITDQIVELTGEVLGTMGHFDAKQEVAHAKYSGVLNWCTRHVDEWLSVTGFEAPSPTR